MTTNADDEIVGGTNEAVDAEAAEEEETAADETVDETAAGVCERTVCGDELRESTLGMIAAAMV